MHRRDGAAHLDQVKLIKERLSIPVLTNGNVRDAAELVASLELTGEAQHPALHTLSLELTGEAHNPALYTLTAETLTTLTTLATLTTLTTLTLTTLIGGTRHDSTLHDPPTRHRERHLPTASTAPCSIQPLAIANATRPLPALTTGTPPALARAPSVGRV